MADPDLYRADPPPRSSRRSSPRSVYAIPGGFALPADHGRSDRAQLRASSLRKMGVLERYDVEMIARHRRPTAIDKGRGPARRFREAMTKIGLKTPRLASGEDAVASV